MKTFHIEKYKIDTFEENGKFLVKVYNTKAIKEWKQLIRYFSFATEENRNQYIMKFTNNVKSWEQTKIDRRENRKAKRKEEKPITYIVKKALADKYGFKNTKVWRGSGTAYGWVHASVYIDQLAPTCENCKDSTYGRCYTCGNVYNHYTKEATEIVYKAMQEAGKKFYSYYGDDYADNTPKDEFLLDIHFKK